MAEYPALPLFTDALLADTDHLTDEEFGAYLRILILTWRSPNCKLPNDDTWLMRRLRADPGKFKDLHRTLIGEFFQSNGNHIFQKRLLKEFEYLREQSRRQSDNAKSRWKKKNDPCHGNATGGICQTDATPARVSRAHARAPARDDFESDRGNHLGRNESGACHGNATSGNAPHPTPPTDKKEPLSSSSPPPHAPAREGPSPSPVPNTHPRFAEVWEFIVGRLPKLKRSGSACINDWLAKGADPELDIFPSVSHAIEVKGGDIGSFNYFTNAVLSSLQVRNERAAQQKRLEEKYG